MTYAGPAAPGEKPLLLACDLDGTLLDSHGHLTDAVSTALHRAQGEGLALAVITARPRRDVAAAVSGRVPDSAYWAYSNGAVIHGPGGRGPRRVAGFTAEQALRIVADLRSACPQWSCALDLTDRTVTIEPFPRQASAHWNNVVPSRSEAVSSLRESLSLRESVPKVLVHTGTVCDATVVAQVQRAVGTAAVATASGRNFVELMPPGLGKPGALGWICAELGVDPLAAVAVGDGLNDVTMLRLAGLGAAPANAPREVRLAADLLLPSNDEGAVAVLVDLLLDGRPAQRLPYPSRER